MNNNEYMISLAMDAFRICIGMKPKTHPAERVLAWVHTVLDDEEYKHGHGLSSRLGPSFEYIRELRDENEKLKAALERRGEIIFGREGD